MLMDLTNQRFTRLKVIERAANDKSGNVRWLCECDCGKQKIVNSNNLRAGKTRSCGCLQKERATQYLATQNENMLNQQFDQLTVIERAGIKSNGQQLWLCRCECGGQKEFTTNSLKRGVATSCGCSKRKAMLDANKSLNAQRVDNVVIPSLKKRVSKNNTSGHKGVSLRKSTGRYEAYICVDNKRKSLGSHVTLEAAIKARKEAEMKYYQPLIDKFEEGNNED